MFCVTSLGFDPLCEESSHYYNNLWKTYLVVSCVGRVLNVKIIQRWRGESYFMQQVFLCSSRRFLCNLFCKLLSCCIYVTM